MLEWKYAGLGLFSAAALAMILSHKASRKAYPTAISQSLIESDGQSVFKREFACVSPRILPILSSLTACPLAASICSSLEEPFLEMFNRGGKRIRPVLCALIGRICNCSQSDIDIVGTTIEALHNASLIIDDIEDSSKMRRNAVCVHEKFGVDRAINSANYMYFRSFRGMYERIDSGKKTQILGIFLEEMTLSHMGQAEDLYCHHLPFHNIDQFIQQIPDRPQYLRLVVSKTGSLLRMMVRWLSCLGEVQEYEGAQLIKMIENLAICFQIRDDLINIRSTMGKGVQGQDLLERKITLMVIETVRLKDRRFIERFCKDSKTQQDVEELIRIMKDNGSQKVAQRQCEYYGKAALKALMKLPRAQARMDLQKVLEMIIRRNQ